MRYAGFESVVDDHGEHEPQQEKAV